MMSVMFMGRDRVPPEAAVPGHVDGQTIVVAKQDRLSVAANDEIRWKRPVECPQRERPLVWEVRMQARSPWRRRVDPGVEARWNGRIVRGVDPRTHLRHFHGDRRWKVVEPLGCPHVSRRPTLARSKATTERRVDGPLRLIGTCSWKGIQRAHRIPRQHVEAGHGLREWLDAEERAGRRGGGYVTTARRVRAADERVQTADGRQEARTREKTQLQEIT